MFYPSLTHLLIILRVNAAGDAGDGNAAAEVVLRPSQVDALDGEVGPALNRARRRPKGGDAGIRTHGARFKATRRSALSSEGATHRRTLLTIAPRAHQIAEEAGGEGG